MIKKVDMFTRNVQIFEETLGVLLFVIFLLSVLLVSSAVVLWFLDWLLM
jgi:hypothetical protein